MREQGTRLTPAHALCAYAEPLARGGRLLVVADASHDLAARFMELGARSVHTYDADAQRAASAAAAAVGRGAVIRALPAFDRGEDFEVRDGAYDLAFVPDLGQVPDPAALLARLRRVLGAQGVLLVGARNPEVRASSATYGAAPGTGSIAYADLYDLVNLQFASIRMLAQLPFRGVVVAELGLEGGEPEVTVDTQLAAAAAEESGAPALPEIYLALASQRDVRLDAYTVIQLPGDDTLVASSPSAGGASPGALAGADVAALAEARLRADVLQSQLDEAKGHSQRAALQDEARAQELEATLARLQGEARAAEARANEHHARTEHLAEELSRLETALVAERERGRALVRQLEDERAASQSREDDVAASVAQQQQALDEGSAARFRVLEASLAETHAAARALETRAVMAEDVLLVRTEELRVVLDELDALRTAFLERAEEADRGEVAAVIEVPVPATDPALIDTLNIMAVRAEQAEAAIARLEADLSHASQLHADELGSLEAALRERAQTIQSLDREIGRRERLVQELVATVEELREHEHLAAGAPAVREAAPVASDREGDAARLRAQLEHLSLEIARREGELEARAWRISELEREVSLAASAVAAAEERASRAMEHAPTVHYTGEVAQESGETIKLRLELDALRQALAQEHADKQQADKVHRESSGLLEEARAELARQTVLIEQLSRELAARGAGAGAGAGAGEGGGGGGSDGGEDVSVAAGG
jgi:hypothetical protein